MRWFSVLAVYRRLPDLEAPSGWEPAQDSEASRDLGLTE
jgi:hypothetical protein